MTQTPSRDWQKDMHKSEYFKAADPYNEWAEPMIYWLQEARELQQLLTDEQQSHTKTLEREQRLKEEIGIALGECKGEPDYFLARKIRSVFATLYPDTPTPKEGEDTDWLNEETCARCGRNKPVKGYEWCSECRPDLKAEEGDNQ